MLYVVQQQFESGIELSAAAVFMIGTRNMAFIGAVLDEHHSSDHSHELCSYALYSMVRWLLRSYLSNRINHIYGACRPISIIL
jgi:hypothetical protein